MKYLIRHGNRIIYYTCDNLHNIDINVDNGTAIVELTYNSEATNYNVVGDKLYQRSDDGACNYLPDCKIYTTDSLKKYKRIIELENYFCRIFGYYVTPASFFALLVVVVIFGNNNPIPSVNVKGHEVVINTDSGTLINELLASNLSCSLTIFFGSLALLSVALCIVLCLDSRRRKGNYSDIKENFPRSKLDELSGIDDVKGEFMDALSYK